MNFQHPEYIVETAWLAAHLNDANLRVLDATTHLLPRPILYDPKPGIEDFERGHIPGAAFVDIEGTISDHASKLHFMLPPAQQFADAMSALGVSNDTFVVCYATANHWWATRLWWMLRAFGHDKVAVLNGGFQKWAAEGRAIEQGAARSRAKQKFVAQPRSAWVVGKDEVRAAIGAADTLTVNALRPEQHAGTGGTVYGRLGRIQGSINIPAANVVDAQTNAFKPAAELRAMLAPALAAPRVITYCGGGIAATSISMLLMMFGHPNVQLYDASMSEWAQDASLPMQGPARSA
jgi:thiosulfate/3-mercaptopyruvate sulfurtransferase